MNDAKKYSAPALDKGLDILELLASSPHALSQAEIAKELGRTTNENYRMIDTLVRRGYLTRNLDSDRYMLSLKLLIMANVHSPRRRLLDIAEPLMRKLSIDTEQSNHLALWEDGDVVIASSFSAPGNWRLSLRPGSVVGLYNTGSGHVLASFQPSNTLDRMIREHHQVKGEKKISLPEFRNILAGLREKGFSSAPSETVRGAVNLSFPVLNRAGNAIAALTCPFLERIDTYEAPNIEKVAEMVNAAAVNIGREIDGE